jgi:CHAT domain-containing protein
MDLSGTQLVVLSPCDTGLGDIQRREGVFGLRRAFAVAGARTLVMSLWKVPDAQTRELTRAFYEELKLGRDVAEALHIAQNRVRQIHPHPYFWAAFICQGSTARLSI